MKWGTAILLILVTAGCKGEGHNSANVKVPVDAVESNKPVEVAVDKNTAAEKGKGPAGIEWVKSEPAGIEFTKTEITVAQYRVCYREGKCTEPEKGSDSNNWDKTDRDEHPINGANWHQAKAFCAWAGGRLATEEEWHAEASEGNKRDYPWGDQTVTCEYAVMDNGINGCGRDTTWPVCSKPAGNSVSGMCDMSGNVFEWTSSAEGTKRIVRGGAFNRKHVKYFRASNRKWYEPDDKLFYLGFRCARDVQ